MSEAPHRHPDDRDTPTLIYDGECRLCVTAKAGLERAHTHGDVPQVRWLPYQSDEAARRLGDLYRPGRPSVAFMVDAQGRIVQGLDAFVALLPGLRGGWILRLLWRVPLLRPLAYAAYRLIARYRYRWFGSVPFTNDDSRSSGSDSPPSGAGTPRTR